ncbi:MAG: hypothetical protein M1829_006352 [Trizodia sp. TS-e1964]|nr:MAG: hypothetical protein M1829_006352 [Trizodia sp. TS-e1964]
MAAEKIDSFVLICPNLEWAQNFDDFDRVLPNISYTKFIDSNIQTLSSSTISGGQDIYGFLYVPDLLPNDPCTNLSSRYVPSNVTRQANLPRTDYDLVALAPWINPQCTLSYLEAARGDPVRAFIFYLTDLSVSQTPAVNDPVWSLNDGGEWKLGNPYPVIAVPGSVGNDLMTHLSFYSGNMSDVEYGHSLTEIYDSRDYARIYVEIGTGSKNTLPSLWALLLIVLAALFLFGCFASLLMHLVQYFRRRTLRRRILSGDVDLEALGIKKISVPLEMLERLPLLIFTSADAKDPESVVEFGETSDYSKEPRKSSSSVLPVNINTNDSSESGVHLAHNLLSNTSPAIPIPKESSTFASTSLSTDDQNGPQQPKPLHGVIAYAQDTCPICLEDFISGSSRVRELPCSHIFHPECVDTFLSACSRFCPLCKKSVLPDGFCPNKITNAMVHRERMVRRIRNQASGQVHVVNIDSGLQRHYQYLRERRVSSFHRQFGRTAIRQSASMPEPATAPEDGYLAVEGRIREDSRSGRRWAVGRARDLVGMSRTTDQGEAIAAGERPSKWRRAITIIFPTFGH